MSFPSRYPYTVHSVALALVCDYYQGQPAVWVERDGQMAAGPYAYDEDRVRRAVELYEEQSCGSPTTRSATIGQVKDTSSLKRTELPPAPASPASMTRSNLSAMNGAKMRSSSPSSSPTVGNEVMAEALAFLTGPTCGLKPAEAKRKLAQAKGATVEELVVCVLSGGK
jgi:hypothetical protein